jgi:hypothetical protein
MRRPLQGRELEIFNAWRQISAEQASPASVRQVADKLGVKRANVQMVATRLIRKTYLERLENGVVRIPYDLMSSTKIALSGESATGLTLTIQLTGDDYQVLDDIEVALDRLRKLRRTLVKTIKTGEVRANSWRKCLHKPCSKLFAPSLSTHQLYCSDECSQQAKKIRDQQNRKERRRRSVLRQILERHKLGKAS